MLLTAREAADRLGIKLDTLYAYVSRGRLRSVTVPGTRQRRYRAADVEALRDAAAPGRATPADALAPIIVSSICLIEGGRLYYRGHDAIGLAETATLEEVAALLWGDAAPHPNPIGASGESEEPTPQASEGAGPPGLIERCQARLAALADADLLALDLTRLGVVRTGRRILHALAGCVAPCGAAAEPVHLQLAAAWDLDDPAPTSCGAASFCSPTTN